MQQLASALHERFMMYSTAMNFLPAGASIEPCESDFVAVVAGAMGISESPVQIVLAEAKTEKPIDGQDVRKLGKLADAVPRKLAQTYILFSKTGTFPADEHARADAEFAWGKPLLAKLVVHLRADAVPFAERGDAVRVGLADVAKISLCP